MTPLHCKDNMTIKAITWFVATEFLSLWDTFYQAESNNKHSTMIFYFFFSFVLVVVFFNLRTKPNYQVMPNSVGLHMHKSHFCMLNLMSGCDFQWFLQTTFFFLKPFFVVKYKNAIQIYYFIVPLALQYTRAKSQVAACPVPICAQQTL